TLLLLVITFGSLSLHQRAMRTMVGERDERATRAAAAAIAEQLNHRAAAIRTLAFQAAALNDPEQALAATASFLPDFDVGLAVFSADGELLAASNGEAWWRSPGLQQQLVALRETNGSQSDFQFLPAFVDSASGEQVVLVGVDAANGLTAVGAFHPATLARRAIEDIFNIEEQTSVFLVGADGQVLYRAGPMLHEEANSFEHPGVLEALRGASGATYLEVTNDEHVVAFSPVPPVNWALVVEEPWRVAADPQLRASELAPLILVPVLIVALMGLWFGVRQIVQPLQALERKATALGWGDFAAIEEPVGGINEIQRLQTELIHMAQKVKTAQQSLRGYLGAITTGQEEERRRLARDLHDDTIQSLIALNQRIQLAQLSAKDETTTTQLLEMQQMATQTIADLRRLTRDLRPIYLEELGLVPAVEMLARDTSRVLQIAVDFRVDGTERRLSPQVELALYRVVQEALSNVVRHAQASCAEVQLHFTTSAVTLTIRDDGRGFVVPESPAEMAPSGHFGLLGVQERVEALGARLVIRSAPGIGTRLEVTLPLTNDS
ncbi:MAG TPA: ATP-binding protein, partial [Anaerolineae bacterium]